MKKVSIIGGAGYTGGELIRLILHHPQLEITQVYSRSQAGKAIAEIHQDLWGQSPLLFQDFLNWEEIEVLFLCMGHGESSKFMAQYQRELDQYSIPIIDLSQDYRWNEGFTYGLPELQKEKIQKTGFPQRIANPGCFATAIQLALLPLAQAGLLKNEVHIHALTGSTGAGQSLRESSHFSWRNNNISVYKAFQHQHLMEIRRSIQSLQKGACPELNFIPMRGDFTRGIFASLYTEMDLSEAEAYELYQAYYLPHPFTQVIHQNPHLKQVVGSNNAFIHLEKHENKLFIISMIDNLLKGAAGQAIQNLNLLMGWEEDLGLKLKSTYF